MGLASDKAAFRLQWQRVARRTGTRQEELSLVVNDLARAMRDKWDHLGHVNAQSGAFVTGHLPAKGSLAYLCRFYAGLSEDDRRAAEAECDRAIPEPYWQFLRLHNGARLMNISLQGFTGQRNLRDLADPIGQPISLRYENLFFLRPDYIPHGHFGLGAMNGDWYSQGHLYLASTGEVELINCDHYLIAARWPSFAGFLRDEVSRQLARNDDDGAAIKGSQALPGDTETWEELGRKQDEQRRKNASRPARFKRWLGGFLGS